MEPRGIEPLTCSAQHANSQGVRENSPEPPAYSLSRETANDPELGKLVDAWPTLPEPIRRAILALVESGRRQ
jgi:hypothetical protein